jgi:hypothetical protein
VGHTVSGTLVPNCIPLLTLGRRGLGGGGELRGYDPFLFLLFEKYVQPFHD